MSRRLFGMFLLASLAVVAAACGGASSGSPPPLEVRLTAQDIFWSVDEIEGTVGQPIHFAVTNEGLLDHTFEISELGIAENIAPGETVEIDAVFDDPGVYDFFCSVPGHAEAGMKGTIIISE